MVSVSRVSMVWLSQSFGQLTRQTTHTLSTSYQFFLAVNDTFSKSVSLGVMSDWCGAYPPTMPLSLVNYVLKCSSGNRHLTQKSGTHTACSPVYTISFCIQKFLSPITNPSPRETTRTLLHIQDMFIQHTSHEAAMGRHTSGGCRYKRIFCALYQVSISCNMSS